MSEIKELPEGWKWVKLGDAVQVLDNLRKPINSSERQKRIADKPKIELYPYYGATGQVGWIDSYITNDELILVGEDGAPFLDHFKEKAYKIKGKTWVNNHAHILKEMPGVSINDFILHYLNSINYRPFVNGTTRLKLTKGNLNAIPVPIPSTKLQEAIVSKIEELFSELDKGIENLRIAQQQLKTYRQAVLKWAFNGSFTERWRKVNPNLNARITLSLIEKKRNNLLHELNSNEKNEETRISRKIKNAKLVTNEDEDLPKGWCWTNLLNACYLVVDCHNKTAPYIEKGIYLVRTSNIKNGRLILDEKIKFVSEKTYDFWSRRCPPKSGDILFTREAPMGEVAIIPIGIKLCLGQRIMLLRTFDDLLSTKYLHFAIMEHSFQKRMNISSIGTGVKHLRVGDVENLLFPICSTEEQFEIVKTIENRLSFADKLEESILKSLQQAETLKHSILKRAFEGKLLNKKAATSQKPKNQHFYQMQILGLIVQASKKHKISHGEMTISKYAYLVDKIYKIPTYYDYNKWHLGPYSPEIIKAIRNKTFFSHVGASINVLNDSKLFKYKNQYKNQVVTAIDELAEIFSKYPLKERAHKTELLATLCKVIEDSQTLDLIKIRALMKEWKIDLKTTSVKNKAEKFTEEETNNCLSFMVGKGWDKKLLKSPL